MFKGMKTALIPLVLAGIVGCSSSQFSSLPVNEENCKVPRYDSEAEVIYVATAIALNKKDYVNGDYRLGQARINQKTLEKKIENTIPFRKKLPKEYTVMITQKYDQNSDDYPDLIIERGKPYGEDMMTIDVDDNFDGIFERTIHKDIKTGECLKVENLWFKAEKF
jgi:hypothetical protein